MYHCGIQPTIQFNHNVSQHHQTSLNPIISDIKSPSDNTLAAVIQNDSNSHNIAIIASDMVNKTLTAAPTQKNNKCVEKGSVDTSKFSIEERLVAAVWVHERNRTDIGISQIKRDFRQRFGREPPSKNTLRAWERKLFSTGSVCDAPRPGRPINRLSRMEEVVSSVRAWPALSVRARARQLRVPRSTLRTMLRRDLVHAHTTGKQSVDTVSKRKDKLTPAPAAVFSS